MVTKRPLELNLINSRGIKQDYAEFPALGLGKIYDFDEVRKTVESLNKAVPDNDCISDSPIELNIYSSNVPDLSLVDLPGYIQVVGKNQPPLLREKIGRLCEKYISASNIVLAVSAADVDLANSESLKACKRIDPEGKRTIGVITKLDLVDPEKGGSLLNNSDYPLPLGYVGVICPPGRSKDANGSANFEREYVGKNRHHFPDPQSVGVGNLRHRLTGILEQYLKKSIAGVFDSVETDLEECRYQFKVQYNDRPVSAEAYVSNVFGMYKQELCDLSTQFTRTYVRNIVRSRLERRWIEICDSYYWYNGEIRSLDEEASQEQSWIQKMTSSSSSLTKSGIGRVCTQGLYETIEAKILVLMKKSPFYHHDQVLRNLTLSIQDRLKQKLYTTIDQVETSIKPLKFQVEYSERDWESARARVIRLLKGEMAKSRKDLQDIHDRHDQKKIVQCLEQLTNQDQASTADKLSVTELTELVQPAKKAGYLHYRIKNLSSRLNAIESPNCPNLYSRRINWKREKPYLSRLMSFFRPSSALDKLKPDDALYPKYEVDHAGEDHHVASLLIERDPYQSLYPEVYLYVLLEKALSLTSLYVYSEIVQDFLEPIQYTEELQLFHMNSEWIKNFARQNPAIAEQLQLQERKEALERARSKLFELLQDSTHSK